jgi:hypothetical protein
LSDRSRFGSGNKMESIFVIIIVAFAAGLLGRSYYKKYKKGNVCSCGCDACSVDPAACGFPEEREKQLGKIHESMKKKKSRP